MTNNILIQKLRFVKMRVNTLKERLSNIINTDTNSLPCYNGFVPGMFIHCNSFNIFKRENRIDFFRNWLSKTFEPDTPMYNLEYHLQNVEDIIAQYYNALVWKINGITPNSEVITEDVNGLEMVSNTIDTVIEKLTDVKDDIDLDNMSSIQPFDDES